LNSHIKISIEDLGKFRQDGRRIPCANHAEGCEEFYSDYNIGRKEEAFELYHRVKVEDQIEEAKKMTKKQCEEDALNVETSNELKKNINYILNNVLTVKCEHCEEPLGGGVEDEDCFALKCTGCINPQRSYCGFCFISSLSDIHEHVESHGCGLWGRKGNKTREEYLEYGKNMHRKRMLTKYISKLEGEKIDSRMDMIYNVKDEMTDLGLDPNEFLNRIVPDLLGGGERKE
jgi:hypothetical protein